MTELNSFFQNFYDKLILRDAFGKIVPGIIILGAILYPYVNYKFFSEMNIWTWLIVIGISWILGFAVQAFGEATGLIRYYPKVLERKSWQEIVDDDNRLINWEKLEYKDKVKGDQHWQDCLNDFSKASSPNEKQQRERYVVIKEACGNAYTAMSIGLIKIIADTCTYKKIDFKDTDKLIEILIKYAPTFTLVILIIVFLRIMHLIHVDRQFRHMLSVLKK